MNEACITLMAVLPSRQNAAVLVEPGEQPLDLPATLVSTQHPPVLGCLAFAIASMRCDQFDAIGSEPRIERITVVGTIPDKSLWQSNGDSRIDGSVDKGDFMWACRIRVHGDWKTCSVRNCHELRTFAALGLSNFEPPLFRHHERAVDEAFGQIDLAAQFQISGQRRERLLQRAILDPAREAAEAGRIRRIPVRHVGPRSAGTQHPEDAIHDGTIGMFDWSTATVCTA